MLNFNELKKLEELKKQLKEEIRVINYDFNDAELKSVFHEIEKYPEGKRDKALWQQIVKEKTGVKLFRQYEALEFSDINYIHQQIQDLLRKK